MMNPNSSSPILILPIETKVREFHGKLYFAYMAARSGFTVYIGEQARMWNYADLFPKGTYIDKSVAATRVRWFERLQTYGHRVVSWDEEGLLFFSPEMYQKLRLDKKALQIAELFFCWGETQRQVIASYYPEYSEKLLVCGNPRFDLLRKDRRDVYSETVAELKKKYGKIILINTNFAFWNHFRSKDELHEMLQSYPLASEPGYIDGWVEYQRQGFQAFCEIIPAIGRRYPEHTIIVRPHPSENHETWRRLAENHPNIVVNAEGNVHEWIMAADVLLHDNCTTAVEAFVLGVPAISYRKLQNEKYENALPKELSYTVQTDRELYGALDLAISKDREFYKKIWSQDRQAVLQRYIAGMEGMNSVESMLQKLTGITRETCENRSLMKCIEQTAKISWRKILHRYREHRNPPDGYSRQKFPGMSRDEISDTLSGFDRALGTSTQFSIKKIAKDIYAIHC